MAHASSAATAIVNTIDDARRARKSRPYLGHGLAIAAAGGGLLWWGLRTVEVPVRFDLEHLEPTREFRVSRSLGW